MDILKDSVFFNNLYLDKMIQLVSSEQEYSTINNYLFEIKNLQNLFVVKGLRDELPGENFEFIFMDYLKKNKNKLEIYLENLLDITDLSISACIIVKNEEDKIKRAIKSVINFVDEVVVVDTGSIDKTKDIIKSMGPKVNLFEREWTNDFSQARNYCISKARKEWIMFLDSDEYVKITNIEQTKTLLKYLSKYENPAIVLTPMVFEKNLGLASTTPKLFLRNSQISYFGLVHEELRVNGNSESVTYIQVEIDYIHDGYVDNGDMNNPKIQRNISLLRKMLKIENANPRWRYFLVRDGYSLLEDEEIETIVMGMVKKNTLLPLDFSNIKFNPYLYLFLMILCRKYHQNMENEKLREVNKVLIDMNPEGMDSNYYKFYLKGLELKNEENKLLEDMIRFRKLVSVDDTSHISYEGTHLDFLIAGQLFDVGYYKASYQMFSKLDYKAQYKSTEFEINCLNLLDTFFTLTEMRENM